MQPYSVPFCAMYLDSMTGNSWHIHQIIWSVWYTDLLGEYHSVSLDFS